MPIYEYRCRACGRRIEKIQSFSAEPLKVCEACGGELERLVSPPAIQFKGSGWYVTDYSHKSGPSAKSDAKGTPSDAPAAAPGAAETKPAASDAAGSNSSAKSENKSEKP